MTNLCSLCVTINAVTWESRKITSHSKQKTSLNLLHHIFIQISKISKFDNDSLDLVRPIIEEKVYFEPKVILGDRMPKNKKTIKTWYGIALFESNYSYTA